MSIETDRTLQRFAALTSAIKLAARSVRRVQPTELTDDQINDAILDALLIISPALRVYNELDAERRRRHPPLLTPTQVMARDHMACRCGERVRLGDVAIGLHDPLAEITDENLCLLCPTCQLAVDGFHPAACAYCGAQMVSNRRRFCSQGCERAASIDTLSDWDEGDEDLVA